MINEYILQSEKANIFAHTQKCVSYMNREN